MKIILASASPRRAEVLRDAGIGFKAMATDTDETRAPGEAVEAMVRRLAGAKARAAFEALRGKASGNGSEAAIILAADTTVEIEGESLGKPGSADAARAMLERLAGKTHRVHTGVAMIRMPDGAARLAVEQTEVRFASMTATEIETYVATGEPFDKAGGYGIQGFGGRFVEHIEGCYFNVVGLPLARVYRMLRELGWQPERN